MGFENKGAARVPVVHSCGRRNVPEWFRSAFVFEKHNLNKVSTPALEETAGVFSSVTPTMHHRALSFAGSPLAATDMGPFGTSSFALDEGGLVSPTSQLLISPKMPAKAHALFSSRHQS